MKRLSILSLATILIAALLVTAGSLLNEMTGLVGNYESLELEKKQSNELILMALKATGGVEELRADLSAESRGGTAPVALPSLVQHYRYLGLVLAPLKNEETLTLLPEAAGLGKEIFTSLDALGAALDLQKNHLPETTPGLAPGLTAGNRQAALTALDGLKAPLNELAYFLAEMEKSSFEGGDDFIAALQGNATLYLLAVPALGGLIFLLVLYPGARLRSDDENDDLGIAADGTPTLDGLKGAIGALSEGLALFDGEDRLILCNDSYQEMYGSTGIRIEVGTRFEDIFRSAAESGLFLKTDGNTTKWLSDILKRHTRPTGSYELNLSDGRIIRVNEKSLHGANVGIHTDVTGLKQDSAQGNDPEEYVDHSHPLPDENPEPVLRVTLEGEVLYANPASRELMKQWETEVKGFVPEPVREKIADACASGTTRAHEIICGENVLSLLFSPRPEDGIINIYGRTVTGQRAHENFLSNIVQNLSRKTGEEFLVELVTLICKATGSDYAYVGEVWGKGQNSADTSAIVAKGKILDNFTFDLANEPCRDVLEKGAIILNGNIAEHYPHSALLSKWSAQSYAGTPLLASTGQPIGILAVFSEQPFSDTNRVRAFIEVAADRAAAELERIRSQKETTSILSIPQYNPHPLIRISKEGAILFANPAAGPILESWGCKAGERLPETVCETSRKTFAENIETTFSLDYKDRGYTLTMVPTPESDCLNIYAMDVTGLLDAEEALRRLSEQTEMILNSAGEGIIGMDNQGRTTFCNPAVQSMTGWSPAELVGLPLHDVIHHSKKSGEVYEKEDCPTFLAIRDGQSLRQEEDLFWRRDGTFFQVEYSCNPIVKDGETVGAVLIFRDVSELHQRMEAVNEREARLNAIVETSAEAIITIDEKGIVESFNLAAEKNFGYGADEVIGNNISMLMPAPYRQEHDGYLAHHLETGEKKVIGIGREVTARRKNGETFPIDLAVSEVDLGTRRIFTGLIRDITQRKNYEHQLEAAKDEAEAATLAKSEFLAVMSHEVRTPMNGVLGMLELLEESGLQSAQKDFVRIARDSGTALLTILNDILDFSKMEAGHLALKAEKINVEGTIENVVNLLAPHAITKDIELTYLVAPEIPHYLAGDDGRLRQVLLNLIGNAIKFTPHGDVRVVVSMGEETKDKITLHFEITDTGIGIAEKNKEGIFEKFSQADPSYTREFGGTGLGLAISQKIVKAMGGEIDFTSNRGKGSRFWFDLPLEKYTGHFDPPEQMPSFSGLKFLIAECNEITRERLENTFTAHGAEVSLAQSAESALSLLEEATAQGKKFDLVIIDKAITDLSSPAAVKKIHDDPRLNHLKLVLMRINKPSDVDENAAFDLVLSRSERKPVLLDKIARLTGRQSPPELGNPQSPEDSGQKLEESIAKKAATSDDQKLHEFSPAESGKPQSLLEGPRLLLAEDSQVNQLVATNMLTSLGYNVSCANDGADAVDAVKNAPYDLVFMDISMPTMNGFDATKAIRALGPEKKDIPIIAMTANVMEGDRKKCLDAGMDDYIGKPFNKSALHLMLEKWLPTEGKIADAEKKEETGGQNTYVEGEQSDTDRDIIEQAMEKMEAIHPEALQQLEQDVGAEIVPRLISRFVEETSARVNRIAQARDNEDFAALRDEAHTLKSSAWTFGARDLSEQTRKVEAACREEDFEKARELAQGIEDIAEPALKDLQNFLEEQEST